MMARFSRGWNSIVIASQLVPNPISPLTDSSLRSPSSASVCPSTSSERPSKSQMKLAANTAASSQGMTRRYGISCPTRPTMRGGPVSGTASRRSRSGTCSLP